MTPHAKAQARFIAARIDEAAFWLRWNRDFDRKLADTKASLDRTAELLGRKA